MLCFNLKFIILVLRLNCLFEEGEPKIKLRKRPNKSVIEQIAEEEIEFGRKVY